VRQIKQAIRQLLGARKYNVPYRIVWSLYSLNRNAVMPISLNADYSLRSVDKTTLFCDFNRAGNGLLTLTDDPLIPLPIMHDYDPYL